MWDTESFRIFLEFHDLPVDHIFFLLAIQREILGSEDQTQKKKHDGFVIPFMESCREKLASFGLAGDWVICKTMQNRLLLAFFSVFSHHHAKVCSPINLVSQFTMFQVHSSFKFVFFMPLQNERRKQKKTLSPIFFRGVDSNLPTFFSKVTYRNQPYNQPVPNHLAQSLTVAQPASYSLSVTHWHLLALQPWLNHLWRGYLEVENVASFSVFRTPPFSRGDGFLCFVVGVFRGRFCGRRGIWRCWKGFLKFWSRSDVCCFCWNWGGHKLEVTCGKRTQVLGKLEKKSR